MSKDIHIEKIAIKNFKSLYDVSFEPGKGKVHLELHRVLYTDLM